MRIGSVPGSNKQKALGRTSFPDVGSVVVAVSEDESGLRWQVRKHFHGNDIVRFIRGTQTSGQRNPDRNQRDCHVQLPAVQPTVITAFRPGHLGVDSSVGDDSLPAVRFVPDAPRARNTVESEATARPLSVHGRIWATSCWPIRPIRAGSDSGTWAKAAPKFFARGIALLVGQERSDGAHRSLLEYGQKLAGPV